MKTGGIKVASTPLLGSSNGPTDLGHLTLILRTSYRLHLLCSFNFVLLMKLIQPLSLDNGSTERFAGRVRVIERTLKTRIPTPTVAGSKMLCARRATRAPGFARQFQTAATRKSRKFFYQTVSFAAACTVAGAAAAHLHLQNSVIHNDTLPKDLPMSGEVNLKTSQRDRGKELLTSEGWGSNG